MSTLTHKHIPTGLKVKVYKPHGRLVGFGETLGITSDQLILLAPRPDFAALPVGAMDLFREEKCVRFVTMTDVNYQFIKQ
jgi:hypothetical protein